MRSQILLLIIGICICISNIERRKQLVERINKRNSTWKAELYEQEYEDIKADIHSLIPNNIEIKTFSNNNINDLPKAYDLRKEFPYCETLFEIRDQSKCASCWAFASAEVMSDRLCMKSKGKLQTRVSSQNILSCCDYCGNGCFGGNPIMAFKFWEEKGVYYYI